MLGVQVDKPCFRWPQAVFPQAQRWYTQHPSQAHPEHLPAYPKGWTLPPISITPLHPPQHPGSALPSPSAAQRMVELKHLHSSPSPVSPTPSSSSSLRFENCHDSRGGSGHCHPYMAPAPVRLPVRLTSDLPALLLPAPSRGCFGCPRTETSSHLALPKLPPGTSGEWRSRAPGRSGRGSCPLPCLGCTSSAEHHGRVRTLSWGCCCNRDRYTQELG